MMWASRIMIYYIIMEYIDGITLKQYLMRKGRLEYTEATRFVMDISNALRCAHENKIIHRDIKPHNILLTRDLSSQGCRFWDCSVNYQFNSNDDKSDHGFGSLYLTGTSQGRGFVDERSDLYSLGILYYELLTGKLPFDEEEHRYHCHQTYSGRDCSAQVTGTQNTRTGQSD